MKIQEGEVFAIQTKIGFGFLQYIQPDQFGIEIVRVLEPIKNENQITQQEVDMSDRFTIHFIVKAALQKKLISRTGVFKIPNDYSLPEKGREEHNVRGQFFGWHIIDQNTLKRKLKQELSAEELKLPPHGIPNDALLREWLENNWRLENWK